MGMLLRRHRDKRINPLEIEKAEEAKKEKKATKSQSKNKNASEKG